MSTFGRLKTHVKEHAPLYILAGVGGGLAFGVLLARGNYQNNGNFALLAFKQSNSIKSTPKRMGHPGYLTLHNNTGVVYPSQGAAARATNQAASDVAKHISGKLSHVHGNTYTRLREAV